MQHLVLGHTVHVGIVCVFESSGAEVDVASNGSVLTGLQLTSTCKGQDGCLGVLWTLRLVGRDVEDKVSARDSLSILCWVAGRAFTSTAPASALHTGL